MLKSCLLTRIIIVTGLLFSVSMTTQAADGRADYDIDGDGLIEIDELADLNEMRNSLDGSSLYGESTGCPISGCAGYELTTDLDFDTNSDGVIDANDDYWNAGEGWEPIGSQYSPFTAYFDGNDFTIANLMINRASTESVGLFGSTSGATLLNITINGSLTSVSGGGYGVAVLVGLATGSNNLLENCHIEGQVIGSGKSVGMVAGHFAGGLVDSCTASGTVLASGNYAGGLIGQGDGQLTVDTSSFTGSVSGNSGVAGLLGFAMELEINDSYAVADVTTSIDDGAGLVGYWSPGINIAASVNKSFAIGSVTGGIYSGGLIGEFNGSDGYPLTITDSFAQVSVDGTNYLSALVAGVWGDIELTNVYATGAVTGSDTAGLIQDSSGAITVSETYWDTESTGQSATFGDQGEGLTTSELQCPTEPGDAACTTSVFSTWSSSNWDFGTSSEYPVLILNGVAARDSDDDGVWDFYDAFPNEVAASVDDDFDGLPDEWNDDCDSDCQSASGLTLDDDPTVAYVEEDESDPVDSDSDTDEDSSSNSNNSKKSGSTGLVTLLLLPCLIWLRRRHQNL